MVVFQMGKASSKDGVSNESNDPLCAVNDFNLDASVDILIYTRDNWQQILVLNH